MCVLLTYHLSTVLHLLFCSLLSYTLQRILKPALQCHFPHMPPIKYAVKLLNILKLIGMKCYLSVIFICISLKCKSEQLFNALGPFLPLGYLFMSFEKAKFFKIKIYLFQKNALKWNLALEDSSSSPSSL